MSKNHKDILWAIYEKIVKELQDDGGAFKQANNNNLFSWDVQLTAQDEQSGYVKITIDTRVRCTGSLNE